MRAFVFGVGLVVATLGLGACKSEGGSSGSKSSFVQKGIPAGKVVVGYMQDLADPAQCAVITDAPAKKEAYKKDEAKLAEMQKAKVVDSCPTDSVVGTCNVGMGMLVNYSGPKWTKETAKRDCASKPHQTWVE
jgi:hypothetical protein